MDDMETLGDLIAAHARLRPDMPALREGKRTLNFSELEAQAQSLCGSLQAAGLRNGDRVVVWAEKRLEVVIQALAIWKAGGIYVPLDPSQPDDRKAYLLRELEPFAEFDSRIGTSNLAQGGSSAFASQAADVRVSPRKADPATIIFTSGSSGFPKGVTLSHANTIAYFHGHEACLGFTPESKVASFAPFFFDVSFVDTFFPLSRGATVMLMTGLPIPSPTLKALSAFGVTHIIAIVTILHVLSESEEVMNRFPLDKLQTIVTGAEACRKEVLLRWFRLAPGTRMLNIYGPTEASCAQITHVIDNMEEDRDGVFPIGAPHPGVLARLEDDSGGEILEPDTPGEIVLGGPQLMLGYWRRPEATSESIVMREGTQFYRTGDIGIRDKRGLWHFLGRRDQEVKINGRRVNLNEIRNAMKRIGISESHISLLKKQSQQFLFCGIRTGNLIEAKADIAGRFKELRAELAQLLPEYMLPAYWLCYADLPTTASGKSSFRPVEEYLLERYIPGRYSYFQLGSGEVNPIG